MPGTTRRPALLPALLLALLLAGCGAGTGTSGSPAAQAPGPVVEDAWVRTTDGAKDTSMTAAFLTVTNPGDADIRLVSASTDVAGVVQLHEMVDSGGTKVMQEAAGGITVPAGSHVHLAPGGYHVMLMALKRALPVGEEVPLALTFADGTTVTVTAPVKEFVEEEDHYHSPMPSMTPSP
jgi:copper(I)-binding protein